MNRKRIFLILLLVFSLLLTSCSGAVSLYERCSDSQRKILDSEELPQMLIYNRNYGYGAQYEVEDKELITAALDALRQIQIESEYDMACTDRDESIVFVTGDGERCAFCFNDGNFSLAEDKYIYRISNAETLWNITSRIIQEYPDMLAENSIDEEYES